MSINTRDGFWGQEALSSISKRLQKELPGLRGFSERNLKYMRAFYEAWVSALGERFSQFGTSECRKRGDSNSAAGSAALG